MTEQDIIRRLCSLLNEVHEAFDAEHATDCFCSERERFMSNFMHDGVCLEFVERAVREAINANKPFMWKLEEREAINATKPFIWKLEER
jgi:hypothetical protein